MNSQFEKDFQAYAKGKNALWQDSLEQMHGFTVGIDADLLISQVYHNNALKSVQDGHSSLDILVQRQIQESLMGLSQQCGMSIVVVIEGLRPSCLSDSIQESEIKALEKS